jgi:DNA polymerase-3 subunit beta
MRKFELLQVDVFTTLPLKGNPCAIVFELYSSNNDIGENKTNVDAVLNGEDIELSFNYKYFLDCFQSIPTDSISIKLSGNSRPMVISPVSDTSFTYLIMPMNK